MRATQTRMTTGVAWARWLWALVALMVTATCSPDVGGPSSNGWWVGPEGGDFNDPTRGITLHVPAGAIATTVLIRVDPGNTSTLALDMADSDVAPLVAFQLLPDGLPLRAPVTVATPLPRAMEPGRPLAALVFDNNSGRWRRDEGAGTLPAAARVTGDGSHAELLLWHFSGHGAGESTFEWANVGTPVNGFQHVCHVTHVFGTWEGPPFTGWAGANYSNAGFRQMVFEDVFEWLLLRSQIESGEAQVGLVDLLVQGVEVGSEGWSVAQLRDSVLRRARTGLGWLAGRGPEFRYTTFANVADRIDHVVESLSVASAARTHITDAGARAIILFTLSSGVEDTRIDALRASIARTGMLADPSVRAGLDAAISRVRDRRDAANRQLAALLTLGRELIDVEALVSNGAVFFVPVVVDFIRNRGWITAAEARGLGFLLSIAIESLVGNYKIHRRQSELCALATIYHSIAPYAEGDEGTNELWVATYATFAGKALNLLSDPDVGLWVGAARAAGIAIGGAIRWLFGWGEGYTADFWEGERSRAVGVLSGLQTEIFAQYTTPPVQPTQQDPIVPDGTTLLEWPFDDATWAETFGSTEHRCSDQYARDLNTTLGSGDTEIRLGPMYLRAPLSGTVRYAGQSAFDPGRGYQVIIESDSTPGFFVGLAHLQRFDAGGWIGRHVRAGDRLMVAVGNTGTMYAHLHIAAYQHVTSGPPRDRVLRGQSPEGYDCAMSRYAALFALRTPLHGSPRPPSATGPSMDSGVRDVTVDAAQDRADSALPDTTADDVLASVDAMDAAVPSDASPPCTGAHRMNCGSSCVDTWIDNANCGRCGTMCPSGQHCDLGTCLDAPAPDASVTDISVSCTLPHTMNCGAGCTDTWTDNANCGRCATRCASAYHCALGTCVADTPTCTGASTMRCGSVCVNTSTDSTNCGRCGVVCPSGQRCSSGACVPIDPCASVSCPECQTCRSGACAPLADLTTCSSGRECYGGACVARCATNYCQTYSYSSGAWCDANSIVTCTTSGRCRVETSRVACPTSCVAGACTACPTNFADCDGVASNGCEADLRTSTTNCGTCRFACGSGVACHGGICDGSARRIALGATHSCAMTTLGTAQCWGENISGELGNGATFPLHNELAPVGVVDLTNAIDLAAARNSTCAVRTGGTVVCWGHNNAGQLGTGATGMWTSHFVSTVGITNARQITAGWDHVCVATTTDTVSCWGLNLDGRLGDGTTTDRASPVAVTGLTNVAQVEAGAMHTCAVRRDGTVACWGFGSMGRLGTGTTVDQLRPAAVIGISNATAVACARFATCVLRADATVACTGGNDNGELGDGTMTARSTMAPVPGLTNVVQLAMGTAHACVVRRDGTVWCWGSNGGGQLGDGTTTTRLVPTRVVGITGALQVDAGGSHACALLAGGRIVCWGTNSSGQLGDGTTTNRSTPVAVLR